MKLIPISERPDHVQILWDLLLEREPHVNISHKGMPSWAEHKIFIEGKPYYDWRLICVVGVIVGSIYLTDNMEIGIHIFKAHQGMGYGPRAIRAMMEESGTGQYFANIAPSNEASQSMFKALGFSKIQETYIYEHRD